MEHEKLLDVLTSLPVSHAILPPAVCFATSSPANHAICCFIDSSGYASGPIRRCLFINYIIIHFIIALKAYDGSVSPNKRLGAFCGARTRNVQTRSNVMYLRYFANAVGKAMGFLTAYSQGKHNMSWLPRFKSIQSPQSYQTL